MGQQQFARKVQPKMRELASRHVKLIAKWLHNQFSWKQFLMGWMVVLIASKMVLLALTFPFFTLTSLVSLQIFHGVWTIAFFCLTILDSRARLLPNASCLLAGYLPATTVLHILLIPSDYPLPYIITDATTTLLAILTMFALLRMECTQILAEAEEMWQQHPAGHPHHVCPPAHGVHPDSCRGRGDVAAAACCSSQRGWHKLNGIVKRSFRSPGTA